MTLQSIAEVFLIGVATPLTAVCVLPLYPAFISYLASAGVDDSGSARSPLWLGLLVVSGVLVFMGTVAFLFTTVLGIGLESGFVGTVGPWAFGLLGLIGAVLVVDPSGFAKLPSVEPPHTNHPRLSAFGYGFFFGAIIIPCNPGFLGFFFARQAILFDTVLGNMLGFLAFGLGIGVPLLAFAVLSEPFSQRVTGTLARYSDPMNRLLGGFFVLVAAYYLVFIFAVLPGYSPVPPSLPI